MKRFRILGAVFCVLGCIFALLGVISAILPLIENEQFTMIINSLQETSADPLTNTLNAIVVFCLQSGYFLLFCGISLTVAGGLISSSAHKRQKSAAVDTHAASAPLQDNSDAGVPKPAYYPGGLAPPTVSLISEQEEPETQIVSTMSNQKAPPISGGIEPAFSSDASDARKLMLQDEQLVSRVQTEQAPAPDYSQYLSNNPTSEPDGEASEAKPAHEHSKPKIVSTMGKNRGEILQ